jgi:hypothetical protein
MFSIAVFHVTGQDGNKIHNKKILDDIKQVMVLSFLSILPSLASVVQSLFDRVELLVAHR